MGTGSLEWQVSTDGGTTWERDAVVLGQHEVRVQAVVSWSRDAGYAFGYTKFDVAVSDASAGDEGVEPSLGIYNVSRQTIVATRFGDTIKIDDARDTLAPGAGSLWAFPGQLSPQFQPPDTSNSAVILTFSLYVDDVPGRRDIGSLFFSPSEGNSTDRFLVNYADSAGAVLNLPLMTYSGASVTVLPGPAPAAIGLITVLSAHVRRSRRTATGNSSSR